MTKSQAIRKINARKMQATLDLEAIIRKYESTLLKIAKRNDIESIPECTLDDLSFNKIRRVPRTQTQANSATCAHNKTANNSSTGNNGSGIKDTSCVNLTESNSVMGKSTPFSFVKTTCNCCTSEKIPKANDVIRTSDTDRLVSKRKCDATDTTIPETANITKISSEPIIHYYTDKEGVNWFTEIDPTLLKRKSRFSVSLLHWYKSPAKISRPKFRYKVLSGLVKIRNRKVEIYENRYGIRPDSPTYVATKLDATCVPQGNKYKPTTVERTKRSKRSGILKLNDDIRTRDPAPQKSVRFSKAKRRRPKKPSRVPIINGHARKRLWEAVKRKAKATPDTKGRFCVDSGATLHLIKSTKWLSKILNRHKAMIKDAVGKAHPSGDSGPIQITVKKRNGTYYKLRDIGSGSTLDQLMHNLLSVSQLCDRGYTVIFKPENAEIHTPDKTIIPLCRRGGLYFVEGESTKDALSTPHTQQEKSAAVLAANVQRQQQFAFLGSTTGINKAVKELVNRKLTTHSSLDTLERELAKADQSPKQTIQDEFSRTSTGYRKPPAMKYWRSTKSAQNARNAAHMWHLVHRRMGHPSRAVTDGLVRSGKFGYIPMCDERDKFCEKCARAAFFRPTPIKGTTTKSVLRGAKWHVDLAGPFRPDRRGHKYTMNMVDDCSGLFWGTTLKSKDHAVKGLREFLSWLQQQKTISQKPIHDISCLQSDRGGEFTSGPEDVGKKRSLFDKICKRLNITRRLTSAKSPNQNGRAERANRTLFSSMRCNLLDSGLGWKHWGDAYRTGLTARNYTPRESGKLSRFEKFYGYAPSYKRLMPFGAIGFLEHKTDKQSITRSRVGRMIGYPKDTKGWLFIRDDGTLEATSHARFDTRNYMERAIAKGNLNPTEIGFDPSHTSFEETEGTAGMPLGGTDAEIRKRIKQYEDDIIVCSETNEDNLPNKIKLNLRSNRQTNEPNNENSSTNKEEGNKKEFLKKYIIMTQLEAEGAIQNARETGYTLQWNQTHTKRGKSGPRYEKYKTYKTFDDVDAAVLNKSMLPGDLRHDVMKGHCKLIPPTNETPKPSTELEAIEINIASLADEILTVNQKIGPIERLYDLRTRLKKGDAIKEGDWNTKLISAVHTGCVMGWDDKGTKSAMQEFALATLNEIVCGKTTPLTIHEAKALPEWELWKASMVKEFKALQDMGVFELVKRTELPKGSKVVKTKWIYKLKQNEDGTISKYKSRLVAQGFLLRWGIDYYDTYSSVVGYNTLRLMLNISNETGEQISQADIGNAYVESSPDSDVNIYTTLAPGMEDLDPKEYVYRMKKSLYGIPFSGRTFQRVMEEFMIKLGFQRCTTDKCTYIKWVNGERIIVLTYVDDLISMTKSDYLRQWWKSELSKRFKVVTFEDKCEWILNMKIERGEYSNGQTWIQLSQELAITKIAQACGLTECRKTNTPIDCSVEIRKTTDEDKPPSENWSYPSVLGGVLYVAGLTRPDIAYATSRLTRYLKRPNDVHCQALKRLVKYLWTTKHVGLRYNSGSQNPFRLTAASDASFGDCVDTKRSTLGWCQWLGDKPNGLISWGSRIGKNVALSTTESEVQAALELLRDILWTRDFLSEIGYRQTGSTRIYEDNNGCIGQATATKGLRRARHYLIALAALNEACQAGDVHMYRVDSDDNTADFFTKGLGGQKHSKFGSESLGFDLSFLYSSRKIKNPSQNEGEQSSALLLSQKEGEQQIESLPSRKEGELSSNSNRTPDWEPLPKARESPKEKRERIHSSKEEGEFKSNKPVFNQTDGNEESMKIHYVSLAEKYAEQGNEPKFNMYFKLAKFVGHRPKS